MLNMLFDRGSGVGRGEQQTMDAIAERVAGGSAEVLMRGCKSRAALVSVGLP